MADSPAGAGSLSNAFKKVNHWRMVVMDLSMIGVAIGALVASGGATGFLDPVLAWAKMHVSGLPSFLTAGPQFLTSAFQQAGGGVWFTGITPDMGAMHAGHAMAGSVPTIPDPGLHHHH